MVSLCFGVMMCMGIIPHVTRSEIEKVLAWTKARKEQQRICIVDLAPTQAILALITELKAQGHIVEYFDHHIGGNAQQDLGYDVIKKVLTEHDTYCVETRKNAPSCASLVHYARKQEQAPTVVIFDQDFDGMACALCLLELDYPGLVEDANYMDDKRHRGHKLTEQARVISRAQNLVTPFYVDAKQHEKDMQKMFSSIVRFVSEKGKLSPETQAWISEGIDKEQFFRERVSRLTFLFRHLWKGIVYFDLLPYLTIQSWFPIHILREEIASNLGEKEQLIAIRSRGSLGVQVYVYTTNKSLDLRRICPPSGKSFVPGKATIPYKNWQQFLQNWKKFIK